MEAYRDPPNNQIYLLWSLYASILLQQAFVHFVRFLVNNGFFLIGGYMAVPNDHEEDVFISDMVASYNLAPWLGANDLQEEGVWRSVVDNEPL